MKRSVRFLTAALALLLLLLPLTACSDARMKKVIGTCAGVEVLYEELRYVAMTNRALMQETYGKDIWTKPELIEKYRPELERTVWSSMVNNYAVLALCQEYGLSADTLNDKSIQDAVEADIREAISQYGGKEAFRQALQAQYMTEDFVRFSRAVAQLENELLYVLTDDLGVIMDDLSTFVEWLEAGNCVRVQHVFIRNDSEDSVEDNRATAESIRQQLLQGESIGTFINSKINEDYYNTAPYYIVRDVYIERLERAAFSLHYEGAVSEVVEVDDGFYVIVRMEDSTATLYSSAQTLLQSYQWARLEKMVEEKKEGLAIELNEYGKSLDLVTLD